MLHATCKTASFFEHDARLMIFTNTTDDAPAMQRTPYGAGGGNDDLAWRRWSARTIDGAGYPAGVM